MSKSNKDENVNKEDNNSSPEKKSDNHGEQTKSKIDEVVEIAPLKEITNKKTGWWSK